METALNGLRVLDLTRYLAGPYGCLLLSDLGAEVIKVEAPDSRPKAPEVYSYKGQDAYFLSTNRGKKSIIINLKKEKGKQVLYDLVKKSDVVVDNYRPGVMARLGIDYDTLSKINPRIICCSITGFGPDGPYSNRPAYDLAVQAMSGGMSLTGEPGGPPARAGIAIGDLSAGMLAIHGILAALYARESTGVGQKVETSLLEAHISLLVYEAAYYLLSGIVPGPVGSGHRSVTPYQAFKTKDDWIAIACSSDRETFALFRTLGRQDMLTDPRFNSAPARFDHQEELVTILTEIFLTKTIQEWSEILVKGDVPCSPINTLDKALSDPQVLHRDMVLTIDYTEGGQIRQVGNPIKMSGTPDEVRRKFRSPPTMGQHTDEILSRLLGYSKGNIEALRKEGIT